MDELGLSFSPFSGNNNGATRDQNGGVSPQEAIRILSLRVPRTVGAAAPIPSALMNAPGGASLGGGQPSPGLSGMNLEMLLRHLFGQPAGQPSMPGGPGMPSGMPSMPGMMAPSGPQSGTLPSAPPPVVRPGSDQANPRPMGSVEETQQQPMTPSFARELPSPNQRDRRY